MNIRHILTVLFYLIFVSTLVIAADTITSKNETTKILIETEDLRTTDFVQFSNNLQLLEGNTNFTSYQQCLYDYLMLYKMSYLGEFSQAKNRLNELFETCDDINIQIRIKSLLANLLVFSREYLQAINDLDFVISHIDEVNEIIAKHTAYTAGFIVYDIVEQRKLSLKFAELLINDRPSDKNLCKAKVYKYISILKSQELEIVEKDINNAINLCKKVGDEVYAQILNVVWLNFKLDVSSSNSETKDVLNLLKNSEDEIELTKYKFVIVYKNSLFSQIYEKLGNREQAVIFANKTIKDSVSFGTTKQKINAIQVLINYYQNNGDYKKANQFLVEKNQSEKKVYSDKQAKLMAYQTVKHDSLAKTHQINSLNQRNKVLQLEKDLSEKSRSNQILLSSLFASLIVMLLYVGYRIKRQQQQYKKLSELDHMTLIYNRKGARDYMDYILPYSEKKREIITYGIFDLDLFKKVNDIYGHLIGDWVIKSAVSACQELNNEKVTFARLGGEEFAIIIRDSNIDEIKQFAEQCRQAIYAIKTLEETGHRFQISASFGITTTQISGYDYSNLMKNADTALYVAKHNGRNQVSVFESNC